MVGECVGKAWNHGVAWGMLGNALSSFGEGWGDLRKAWPMLGGCLGLPGEAWGGSRRLFLTRSAYLWVSLGGLGTPGNACACFGSGCLKCTYAESENCALHI